MNAVRPSDIPTDTMPRLSNADIAAVFYEMAELLKIQGGDRHRSNAFQRAGTTIENLPEPIERMLRYGTLQRAATIGEGTVHRVKQIVRTGTCDDHRRLRAAIPPGLRTLLKLRHLGPRKVRQLYQHLGIASIDQLEAAARSGRLAQLPRFGVDAVHNVLVEIAIYRRRAGKVPLVEAESMLGPIVEQLQAVPGVEVVAPGGSVRRQRAMIGDLDLLASATDPEPVIEAFLGQVGVRSVLARRKDGGSVRLESLQQVDLWVFPPESWGAGQHAFTGNTEHTIKLRTRAGRMGLHISEHGVSTRDRSLRLQTGRTEAEIFAAVGLPLIAVPLRLNLGEIEAADEGRLPVPVTAEDLRGDLHMHTTWSDGVASSAGMARAAERLGLDYIAITDHSRSLAVANGLTPERLRAQGEELRALTARTGVDVLRGIEVDILPDGSLDLDHGALRPLDWVVASVHGDLEQDASTLTARLIRAMETGLVDCIGHPTGRKLGRREPSAVDFEALMAAARRLGVALEVNGNPRRMDLDDVACRQAREAGVMLVINTDAHSPAHLARRQYALAMAQRGWLEAKHVLNTRPVGEVRAWRRDRLRRHGIAVPEVPIESPTPDPVVERGEEDTASDEAASDEADREQLADELSKVPLGDALRIRLQAFLAEGDDDELEAALVSLGGNAIQQAFNLLAGKV